MDRKTKERRGKNQFLKPLKAQKEAVLLQRIQRKANSLQIEKFQEKTKPILKQKA